MVFAYMELLGYGKRNQRLKSKMKNYKSKLKNVEIAAVAALLRNDFMKACLLVLGIIFEVGVFGSR